VSLTLWQQCLDNLQDELNSQQFNTWIRPLQAEEGESNELRLLAPNRFVRDWVSDKYAKRISELMRELAPAKPPKVSLTVGSRRLATQAPQHRDLGNPVSLHRRGQHRLRYIRRPAAISPMSAKSIDCAMKRRVDVIMNVRYR